MKFTKFQILVSAWALFYGVWIIYLIASNLIKNADSLLLNQRVILCILLALYIALSLSSLFVLKLYKIAIIIFIISNFAISPRINTSTLDLIFSPPISIYASFNQSVVDLTIDEDGNRHEKRTWSLGIKAGMSSPDVNYRYTKFLEGHAKEEKKYEIGIQLLTFLSGLYYVLIFYRRKSDLK